MFCQYFPFLSTSCTPAPLSLLNRILCSFPDLTSLSSPPQALPQPPSLVPEPATLQLSSPAFLLFTLNSFLASIVPTQTQPPPPHFSLVASDHFSCTPSSRYLGSTGGEQTSMLIVSVPGAEAACRDWKQPGTESPTQPRELQGGTCSLIPWGW